MDCCPHRCCEGEVEYVEFRRTNLHFAYPSTKLDKFKRPIGWLTREESEAILARTASIRDFEIDLKGFTNNRSRRFAAVELEFIDYKNATELNKVLKRWNCSVVEDGSMLRQYYEENPSNRRNLKPFEINTAPACGDTLLHQLSDISEALLVAKARISLGCGIHVHVDCRDFGYQELHKIIRVYRIIEETLFSAVHFSRYNNEFCTHCGLIFYERFINGVKPDTKGLKSSMIPGLYGRGSTNGDYAKQYGAPNFHRTRADHYGRVDGFTRNPMRYSALNLHSFFLRGTVESRIHHASTDFREIYEWAKILVDLFDAAGKLPEQKLVEILNVKKSEAISALEILNASQFKRQDLNKMAVANGLVVLRSLLPDETFGYLVHKIELACINTAVATKRVLPCQLAKE